MDNSVKKWLIRAGSFLILFGFFIPSMAVSCSVYGMTQEQSFSMSTAASTFDQSILYLVLAGVLVTLVFSFLLPRTNQQRYLFIFGEGGGLGLGVFGILISAISLSSQVQQMGLEYSLKPGFFVLFFGYCIAGFGIVLEIFEPSRKNYQPEYTPPPNFAPPIFEPDYASPPPAFSPGAGSGGARLELVRGNAPRQIVISTSDFQIGRSRQNQCVVDDPQISRVHARIRGAQGSWFIQDQNSMSGTFVNDTRIQAQRLNDGDEIRVGDTTFRFRI